MIKNVLKLTFIDEFLLEQHEQSGLAGLAHLVVAVHETVGDGGQDVGGHRVQRQQLVLVAAHGQVRHLLHHLRTHRRLYNNTRTVSHTPTQSAAHQYNTETVSRTLSRTPRQHRDSQPHTQRVSRTPRQHRDSQPHTNTTPRLSAAHQYNTQTQQSAAHQYTNTETVSRTPIHKHRDNQPHTNTQTPRQSAAHQYNTETQQSAAHKYTNTETVSRTQIHKHRDATVSLRTQIHPQELQIKDTRYTYRIIKHKGLKNLPNLYRLRQY